MIRPEILCRHRTERYIKDKTSFERRFYISSLPAHAERLARSVRAHWTVENRLHWCMDVAFADDRMRARTAVSYTHLDVYKRQRRYRHDFWSEHAERLQGLDRRGHCVRMTRA